MSGPQAFAGLAIVAGVVLLLAPTTSGHPHPSPCAGCDADLGYRHHLHQRAAEAAPQHVGQDTLGAIQEVVGLLMADPETDWSEVSITRLRQHLADFDRVMLRARVDERSIDGGLEVTIHGDEQTMAAVRRLAPIHAEQMDGFRGWQISARDDGKERAADADQRRSRRGRGDQGPGLLRFHG